MQQRNVMSYSNIRMLMISPDAWPYLATPLRPLRRRGSSSAEGSSSSWTLRPPSLGRPSFSFLPPLEGESFLLPPPRFSGRRASRTRRMTSPTTPHYGYSFESLWSSSSWPSFPAPHKAPEPAASLVELGWVFGQWSRTVNRSGYRPPSLSKVREFRSRIELNYEKAEHPVKGENSLPR